MESYQFVGLLIFGVMLFGLYLAYRVIRKILK